MVSKLEDGSSKMDPVTTCSLKTQKEEVGTNSAKLAMVNVSMESQMESFLMSRIRLLRTMVTAMIQCSLRA